MIVRKTTLALTVLLSVLASETASGGAAPDARRQAQTLAEQSLDALRRGEDAVNPKQKMALYEQGLDLANRAVALDEENADAHFAVFGNKGRILMLEGVGANPISLLQVNRDLERALAINPNHADALTAKGGLYRQLPWILGGSLSRAEECLLRAIQLDPDAVSARIELAETYRDMGHPERGVPLLEKAAVIAEREGKRRQLGLARGLLAEIQAE